LRDLSRDLCFALADREQRWDESAQLWRYLRAGAVEFTLREGQGVHHKAGLTQDGERYPLIACNREETIARVIESFHSDNGPLFLLPERNAQTPPILATYEQHLLAGSRMERAADGKSMRYVDHCENHFLLATAYAALAQRLDDAAREDSTPLPQFHAVLPAHRTRGFAQARAQRRMEG
jgi:hypothetical protein